jgi:hypothetical protein
VAVVPVVGWVGTVVGEEGSVFPVGVEFPVSGAAAQAARTSIRQRIRSNILFFIPNTSLHSNWFLDTSYSILIQLIFVFVKFPPPPRDANNKKPLKLTLTARQSRKSGICSMPKG